MLRKAKGATGRGTSRRRSVRFDGADEAALAAQIADWVGTDRRRLGEVLLELGAIHPDALLDALSRQHALAVDAVDPDRATAPDAGGGANESRGAARLGRILVEQGAISEVDLAAALAEQFGVPLADLRTATPEQAAIDRIPEELARRHRVVPLRVEDDRVYLAAADPLDVDAINELTHATGRIGLLIGSPDDIERLIDKSYDALAAAQVHIQAFELIDGGPVAGDPDSAFGVDDNAPIVQVVNRLIWQGVRSRASDIHIEPVEDGVRVRYRVDGALSEAIALPAQMGAPIASRIKVMAELNIVERRRPQDGQFSVTVDGRPIDVRASLVATIHGEKVVLRLLDKTRSVIGLGDLGMTPAVVEPFLDIARAPLGMVLCTGPTGSGKTTTLYATLQEINDPTRNVVTIEDPVEYQFAGVNQMQVSDAGISFADGLRGILRQDPDVILIGEIRDEDTARIAMQASLTGHLVLSSLHAVDAAAAVHRFTDMGIEPFLVASSLNAVIGQRLLRRICTACRTPYRPSAAEVALMESKVGRGPEQWTRGAGCDVCANTGYRGRTGVYELLEISDAVRELIVEKATHTRIHRAAVEEGMVPMQTRALELVADGVTTVEDVLRNVYAPEIGELGQTAPAPAPSAPVRSVPTPSMPPASVGSAPSPPPGPPRPGQPTPPPAPDVFADLRPPVSVAGDEGATR
jgi:type IV pilus assembly protein PilB